MFPALRWRIAAPHSPTAIPRSRISALHWMFQNLNEWCKKQKINFTNRQDLINVPKVKDFFQKEINILNKNLGSFEKIRKFKLVCDEWTHHTGELSPTLKLKRRIIHEKYKHLIEKMFLQSLYGKIR